MELECFKDVLLPTPENIALVETERRHGIPAPNILTNAQIADLLIRGKNLVAWYGDLEEYALKTVLAGVDVPGWKAVAGTSRRQWTDQDAAVQTVLNAGYPEALVYDRNPKSLAQLERLLGKDAFAEKVGQFVIKPLGKPTLVPVSDKREPYSTVEAAFGKGVTP